ncbi:MAG: ABC transporter permease subunit [Thermoanaerobaculia bacterium]
MTTESLAAPTGEVPRTRQRTASRRLLADRISRWAIAGGGMAIIAGILGILVFILLEVWPLTWPAEVGWGKTVPLAGSKAALALIADEHRTTAVTLEDDGVVRAYNAEDGSLTLEHDLLATPARLVAGTVAPGESLLAAAFSDGRAALIAVQFPVRFEGRQRVVETALSEPVWLTVPGADQAAIEGLTGRLDGDGKATVVASLADGGIAVVQRTAKRNMLTGETTESLASHRIDPPAPVTHLLLDEMQRTLYGVAGGTGLVKWSLRDGAPGPVRTASAGASPITATTLLIGDRALIVGHQDGSLATWFPVRAPDDPTQTNLVKVRQFPAHGAAIRRLAPSLRNKGFLVLDEAGELGLYYSTSERVLWRDRAPEAGLHTLTFTPKSDGAFLAGDGELARVWIRNPHPEVSFKALFGKLWYEGAESAEYTWQSTGGTDDFEPKLSLTPLLVGTLKGTIYSLLLAIPLGVFGAMYASQFMHPKLLRFVKPTVEIMAALPSVVLGFLAGLWLAPRLEQYFPALILSAIVLPLVVLAAGLGWQLLPRGARGRFWSGSEVIVFAGAIALGIGLCLALSQPFEVAAFGGSFQTWLRETFSLPYDQRNAVVIGLAMGFAVIPIIFAISEDAFSNVPKNLVAGSLALGANRWQTVTRVVLPSASPGIFSAIMIGFGRAVGETMIVLMATGNTPIMDWNPFNGFRTLSANIAVEIPEAPHGGTLYRVLFLAALLLFVMTFIVNTAAEIVRQRLRKRYSEL